MSQTKEELAADLKKNDPETLEWLQEKAKEYGPAESFAYVRPRTPIKPLTTRLTAAKMSDGLVQSKLDMIVNELNVLTIEAKSRYGEHASLHICPDGRLAILIGPILPPYRTIDKLSRFTSNNTCTLVVDS